jgi:uncharacterized protein YndB with AHSA1/START domain
VTTSAEHTTRVSAPPERVFAILDDPARTPEWLRRCRGMEKLTPGPLAPGSRLRYAYRSGGGVAHLEGEVVARVENDRLTMRFTDRMFEITPDFRLREDWGDTELTHIVEVVPRTRLARLLAPIAHLQLPRQTARATEALRALAER